MRSAVAAAVAAVVVLASSGCESTTVKGEGGQKMTLVRPKSQTLTRGETEKVTITILRENIESDIVVRFDDLPRGVKVVEEDRKVNPDDTVVTYTLYADDQADLVEEHQAKVTVEGPNGLKATEFLELTVKTD